MINLAHQVKKSSQVNNDL